MKRTKQHKIDASAKAILMKNAPKNWSLAEPSEDYGNDYFVKVFDKYTDEATKISFIIQLKGTEYYQKDEKHVKFSIRTDYLKYYYNKVDMPVFLVVVDTINEEYCWLFIQKYINEELNVKKPNWKSQQTITLYISIENTFSNPQIIEQTAKKGSQYCNILVNGTPTQEFIWKVKNITENPLEKSKDLKEQYSKIFEAETKVAFEFIHNQNDSDNAKKHFQSVYNKTKDDKDNVMAHLNSIIGLNPFFNLLNEDEAENLFKYIQEGENLSKENNIKYLQHYFYGLRLEKLCFILQNQLQGLLITQKIGILGDTILTPIILKTINLDIEKIFNVLRRLYNDFSTNLMKTIDENELYISLELFRMLIEMQLHHIQVIYKYTDENTQKAVFNQINQLISIFKKLINFTSKFEIFKYDLLTFKTIYLHLIGDEKYNETVEEYIDFAKENKSQYHIERAESLKEKLSKPFNRQKDISKMSDDEIHDLLKTLIWTIEKIDIDVDEGDEAIVLKRAVRNLNPKKVLDNCKNLELHYGHGGIYAKVFGLASDGVKTIYCKHGGIITNWNLDDAYDEFYNKYCKECEHKIRQDFKWDPDILSYVKSKKFKEILDKNPFIK